MATTLLSSLRPRNSLSQLARAPRQSTAVFKTVSEAQQAQTARIEDFYTEEAPRSETSPTVNFSDPATVFAAKSTARLLQSYAVLKACRVKSLVHNSAALLNACKALVGQKATEKAVEATFFKHFCAGTNAETIGPTLEYLKSHGMMPILNYAAEDDVSKPEAEEVEGVSLDAEKCLDAHTRVFMRSILDCDNTQAARGFVSIKVTALGQPNLLERVSQVLAEVGGTLDRGHSSVQVRKVMAAHLSPPELQAFDNLMGRLHQLASAVYHKGNMRMLVDAEHSYMQPAIDAVAIALQQTYNKEQAVIMNTYQCYLKDTADRIEADLRRAADEGWAWGAKTVRGAYMHVERARAIEMGYESPIQESITATHNNYDSCVEQVMARVAKGGTELMVASHNQASVEKALEGMQRLNIRSHSPGSGIYFGQLLGMADHLSFPLGANGYNIYKICAYGSVNEVIAFLVRRALENSDVLGGCARETEMIRTELTRRMNPFASVSSVPSQPVVQRA